MKLTYLFVVVGLMLGMPLATPQTFTPALPELQKQIGKTIAVVNTSGEKLHGTLAKLDDAHLQMTSNGKTYTFTPTELKEVRKHQSDSLLNGTLIGAGIAVGLAGILTAGFCSGSFFDCSSGDVIGTVALFAGVGAGAGAGIDAMRKKEIPIYQRPGLAMGITSQAGRRNGASVSLKF